MNIDNLIFSSEEEAQAFVNKCENRYLADVEKASRISLNGGRIITLCGPSCSGKTTTAKILDDAFKSSGKELHSISIDDFYFNKSFLIERSEKIGIPLDYDSPATIDIELFGKVIEDIERGGKVLLPKFDFADGKRTHMEEINVHGDDVFLFEGIQAVYPELVKCLKGHDYTSLFISVEDTLNYCGTEFSPREIRFMRRLVRDFRARGASADFTFSLWQSVVANEEKNIYPNLWGVDFKINSTMEYEISVIKPYVLPLLLGIPIESKNKKAADDIVKKLENIPTMDSKYIPDESVFREFIGERK